MSNTLVDWTEDFKDSANLHSQSQRQADKALAAVTQQWLSLFHCQVFDCRNLCLQGCAPLLGQFLLNGL